MQPTWLLMLSWATLFVGLVSAVVVVVDDLVHGYRQPVKVMELIWPVTALYFGPAAIAAYNKWGKPQSPRWRERHGNPPKRSRRAAVVIATCHCSTHCTLGTIIATVTIFGVGIETGGHTLWHEYIGDYVGAVFVGVVFRYSAEAHKGDRRVWTAIRTFVRADLLTVSVFEFALLIWLALVHHLGFPEAPKPNNPVFWLIVQIGLIIGFFAAWPATSWLIHRGVKVEPRGTPQ